MGTLSCETDDRVLAFSAPIVSTSCYVIAAFLTQLLQTRLLLNDRKLKVTLVKKRQAQGDFHFFFCFSSAAPFNQSHFKQLTGSKANRGGLVCQGD